MEARVTLPTGERRTLVLIRDWDIRRQSVYRRAQPLTPQEKRRPHALHLRGDLPKALAER